MGRRAVVVHVPSLLRKALLTSPGPRVDPSGHPTDALYAVAAALRRVWAFKEADVAVAFDSPPPPDAPVALVEQAARWPEIAGAFGLTTRTVADAAASAAAAVGAAVRDGCDVVVVASDKRFAQLVAPGVWWYDAYKDLRYTPELVHKRFGVGPAQVAGVLAFAGDDDTLPGLPGIGAKGACDLVSTFGTAEAALDRVEEVGGRAGKALRADPERARAELSRATLDPTGPPDVPLADLGWVDPGALVRDGVFRALGFHEMLTEPGASAPAAVQVLDADTLAAAIAAWAGRTVAVVPVYDGPSPARGRLVGLGFAVGDGPPAYASMPHALAVAGPWLADPAAPKIGHGTDGLSLLVHRAGGAVRGVVGDTEHASHALEPSNHAPHELSLIARLRLQRALPEEDAVRGVGRSQRPWSALPISDVAAFAGVCADAVHAAWGVLSPQLSPERSAEQAVLAEVLVGMSLRGVACDVDDLARSGDDFTRIAAELDAEIASLAGRSFNWASTKQLAEVLFDTLGLPVVSRTKTGPSTANEALERIEHAHPIVPLVLRARQLQRLRDAWVTALTAAVDPDGRVRSTFHLARSFSGRIVNSSPDLGRVPGKTPEMARIRHAFRAPPGAVLGSLDYVQLGLYVLAHLTGDPELVGPLSEGADLHVRTASAVLDRPTASIGPDERQLGKIVNFATFAGQGSGALSLQLGVGAAEARDLIARFDRHYSVTRAWQDEQLVRARADGFVTTLAGRRWPIGGLDAADGMMRAQAERLARRAAHEGSVADVSRRGLWRADHALRAAGLRAAPVMVVHDEGVFEVPVDEITSWAAVAGTAMREAFALRVPLRVGCEIGPSWAELTPYQA